MSVRFDEGTTAMSGRAGAIGLALAMLAAIPGIQGVAAGPADTGEPAVRSIVFNGEGNRLWVYDGENPNQRQVLVPSASDAAATPADDVGLDMNAQICVHEFGGTHYFIAGEDTDQSGLDGSPGWGWFELVGDTVGELSAIQHGKLIPSWSQAGDTGQENYGCGFLPNGDLLLSDVGDQLPHEPATGQLHLWFLDSDTGFDDETHADVSGSSGEITIDNQSDGAGRGGDDNLDKNPYCMIDRSIGTAGAVAVHDGWAYVASNRPGPNGPGGVYRYEVADLEALDETCAGQDQDTDLVDTGVVTRQLWLPSDAFVLTPSSLAPTGRTVNGFPTWYVASVFTGVIAEYVDTGAARVHLRNVVEPPGGAPVGQLDDIPMNDAGTPYGIAVTPEGNLWYADLGIQGPGPAGGHGSFQRVAIDSHGTVIQRAVLSDGLDFPDGVGVLVLDDPPADTDGDLPETTDPKASSHWRCEWGMYGQGPTREFSLPSACPSSIEPTTVSTLRPKWFVKTAKTVTAAPAVVDGTVYVGDWSRTMYAVDAATGDIRWTHTADATPGAAFGPIVSSAAVTDVRDGAKDTRRLVIFGSGPHLYALRDNGTEGTVEWRFTLDDTPGTFVEIESSPVVWRGVVYVGMGNHNKVGTGVPGGLLALDAGTGEELWRFEPELGEDKGCGTVWSSPVVNDTGVKPLVYFATGNCTRPGSEFEWTPHTEAVTALDARTGDPVWSFQPHEPNRRDEDFGATGNLFRDSEGRLVLGIGNKDGVYHALDPQTGALLWRTKVAEPGNVQDNFAIGGFLGSTATWDGKVFGATAIGGPPYYHSLEGTDGTVRWRGAQAPSYAASAAVNGVVFTGGLDSVLRGYDAETGAVLTAHPLAGPASSGPAVVGDAVYVGSGTSSSDACAKELPINEQCVAAFDQVLGSLGGIHAFEVGLGL